VFEQALIRRVQAGEAEAFYELIRPYERAVFLGAFAIVKNEADAEEVAQEAVLKAFNALGRFRQKSKFCTWLIQIAINEAKMKLRKDRRLLYESIEQGRRVMTATTSQGTSQTGGKSPRRRWGAASFAMH
jgi:RNA polymerase sigma-70 factor, ECF subfamily